MHFVLGGPSVALLGLERGWSCYSVSVVLDVELALCVMIVLLRMAEACFQLEYILSDVGVCWVF